MQPKAEGNRRCLIVRLNERSQARGILQIISKSRDYKKPVFEAIHDNASRLCDTPLTYLPMANEEWAQITIPAHEGFFTKFGTLLGNFRFTIPSQHFSERLRSEGLPI
ncbi:MAG: hypothetical protein V7727_21335 [Sneathiella sp.]